MKSGKLFGCKLVLLIGVAAGLSACGSDDKTTGSSPVIPSTSLATPDGVKATVANLSSAFAALDGIGSIAAPAPLAVSARNAPRAKVAQECGFGGSQDRLSEPATAATSPYTDEAFDLEVTTFSDCGVGHFEDTDDTDGSTGSGDITATGRTAFGGLVDTSGNFIDHAQFGESAAAPLNYLVETSTTTGETTVNVDFNLDLFMRNDYIERPNGTDEEQIVADFSGSYSAQGATFTFESFMGSAANPLIVEGVGGNSFLVNGTYGFSSNAPAVGPQAGCVNGTTTIATDENDPLIEAAESQSGFEFTGGTIELTADGGGSATVQFHDDGTMTITADNGEVETVDQSEVLELGASCASFLHLGLGLAQSFQGF